MSPRSPIRPIRNWLLASGIVAAAFGFGVYAAALLIARPRGLGGVKTA